MLSLYGSIFVNKYRALGKILFLFVFIMVFFYYPLNATGAQMPVPTTPEGYSSSALIKAGHAFFGEMSGNLAKLVEKAYSHFGKPTAYILGEEASAAFLVGINYGEGKLYSLDNAEYKVFWQGPSFGFDAGAQGSRIMMLVYHLNSIEQLWARYGGFTGNAYLVAGLGFTALYHKNVLIIPIRTGVGVRLGANFNYIKFTSAPTWNPF